MVLYKKCIVWKCPNCGKWQGRINSKYCEGMTERQKADALSNLVLKCKFCNKNSTFRNTSQGGSRIDHRWAANPSEVQILVRQLSNMQHAKLGRFT